MDDLRATTEDLLEEKPPLEAGLRSILEVDDERESWEFEDVPLDSGEFGEVVSRGIVVDADDGYRLADRGALAAALGVDEVDDDRSAVAPEFPDGLPAVRAFVPTVERRVAAFLGLALALVVLFRIVPIQAVFRDGAVVLSGNDPYAYRYVVERMAAGANGPFDAGILSDVPGRMAHEEPLMVSVLWWVTEVLGGDGRTAGLVLAWYPVVSAVVTGALTYAFAARVTGDRRVGVAAVTFLAITPLHALRTGVGFADHHPFDYVWLVLTALALVSLVDRDVREPRTWGWAAVLGVAVGAQVLAWDNGPLLLVPLAIYVALRTVSDVRAGRSPLRAGLPTAGGVAVAAAVVHLAHARLGWQTDAVAATPVVLLFGVVGVVLLAEAVSRVGGSAGQLVAVQGIGSLGALLVAPRAFPGFASELDRGIDRLFGMETIVESSALFGGHFEWVIGPLVFFGFALLLVVLYMGWAGWRTYRDHDPALLVAAVYAWFLFALTSLQIRFAGEFSPFAALFAGLGFVHLASWVDLARVPVPFASTDPAAPGAESRTTLEMPERRTAVRVAGLWVGVGSLGAAMSAVKHSQIAIGDDRYEVATWIAADADARGLRYPENYVFSRWGTNRLYNYFVSGESRNYAYAESNYSEFLQATDPETWYDRLDGRVGYVVVDPDATSGVYAPGSTYPLLAVRYGSRGEGNDGSGRFRARYVSDEGRNVFELVPGAVLVGDATESVESVRTDVEIPGASFTYERRPRTDGERYRVRVAYPGRYEVGDATVDVPEAAVRNGETVRVS